MKVSQHSTLKTNIACPISVLISFRNAEGKAGSLVDEKGHFYKPVQVRRQVVCILQNVRVFPV